jgi:methyltransferase (TIGR00027 family)
MPENQVSITALITAFARAYHSKYDSPKIFDDFLAPKLFTPEEQAYFGQNLAKSLEFFDPEFAASCPDQVTALARVMQIQNAPVTLSRSRYTEDSLETAVKQGVQQYVILGAGLETFAFRRPEMVKQLRIFEVDHPATQNYKKQRIAQLGWNIPEQLHFVPVDFSKDNPATALRESGYDPRKSSFFSWLGVTIYLTRQAVLDTLQAIAGMAPAGSIVIFDYLDTDAFIPERTEKSIQLMQEMVRRAGEPIKTGFDPETLARELATLGLHLEENLEPSVIEAHYFKGRTDDYHAKAHFHFGRAIVR